MEACAAASRTTQRSSHVQRGENGFDGDGVWREFRDQLGDQLVDFAQAGGEGGAGGKFQGAETQQARGGADEFDYTIACGACYGWINAEHAEAGGLLHGVRGRVAGSLVNHLSPHKCSARGMRSVVFFQGKAARTKLAELRKAHQARGGVICGARKPGTADIATANWESIVRRGIADQFALGR